MAPWRRRKANGLYARPHEDVAAVPCEGLGVRVLALVSRMLNGQDDDLIVRRV